MTLSVPEAKQIIEKQKQQELTLGTPLEKVNDYLKHVNRSAAIARMIATQIPDMDPEKIYVSALLHDIGRLEEARTGSFHGIIGYNWLKEKDEFAARTALIHMFPLNRLPNREKCQSLGLSVSQEYGFIADYLKNTKMTEADGLIQLADSLTNKNGFVRLKDRFEEYERRHHVKLPIEVIFPRYMLKAHFDNRLGYSIYDLLPALINKEQTHQH